MMEILDASALLCFLKKEKEHKAIYNLLEKSRKEKQSVFIHQLNFIEVVYVLFKKTGTERTKKVVAVLQSPFWGIVNYMDSDLALYASLLKSLYGLSLGDAIGLAYTKIMKGQFWTKDQELLKIAQKERINLKLIN